MRARRASIFARLSGGSCANWAGVSCITCCIIASGWGAEKPLTGFCGAKAAEGPFALGTMPRVPNLCVNQSVSRVHPIIFHTKSFLGDNAAVLAESSAIEPESRRWRGGRVATI